jgi:biotin synthase
LLVRVSDATATVLGLKRGRLDAPMDTAYLMTYSRLASGKCLADCSFCTLSSSSRSSPDHLSRVRWMPYELEVVRERLEDVGKSISRVCLQVVNYPGFLDDVFSILEGLKASRRVSVSTMPLGRVNYLRLKGAGVEKLTIPMDAATPALFDVHKSRGGFYSWERHEAAIRQALEVFGKGNVLTYLIVGLGETDEEAVKFLLRFHKMGVEVALHSFTPVPGLRISGAEAPTLERYRWVQLARYLIYRRGAALENFVFRGGSLVGTDGFPDIEELQASPDPYLTTGCPGCNRPFYNERASGPLYNLPSVPSRG